MSQQVRERRTDIQRGDIVQVDDSQTDNFKPHNYGIDPRCQYRVVQIESNGVMSIQRKDGEGGVIDSVRVCFFERVLRVDALTGSCNRERNWGGVGMDLASFFPEPLPPKTVPIDLPFSFAKETLAIVSLREAVEKKLTLIDPRALSPYRKLILVLVRICTKSDYQFQLVTSLPSPYVSSYAALRSVERKMMVRELFDALECELIRRNYKEILDLYDSQFSPTV